MSEALRWIGPSTRITGKMTAAEDLTVDGQVEGKIVLTSHHLTIGPSARLKGDVFARAITVQGTVDGTLTASERVEIQAGATVGGRIVSPRLALADGARFNGRVEPHKAEAALRVQQYRMAQAGGGEGPAS